MPSTTSFNLGFSAAYPQHPHHQTSHHQHEYHHQQQPQQTSLSRNSSNASNTSTSSSSHQPQKSSLPSSTYNKHNCSSITRNSTALPPSTTLSAAPGSIEENARSNRRVRFPDDLAMRYAPGNGGYFCRRSKPHRRSSRDGGDVKYALSRGLIKKCSS